jgi:hypothetical protein
MAHATGVLAPVTAAPTTSSLSSFSRRNQQLPAGKNKCVSGVVGNSSIQCSGGGSAGAGSRGRRRATRTAAAPPHPSRPTSPSPRRTKVYRTRNKNLENKHGNLNEWSPPRGVALADAGSSSEEIITSEETRTAENVTHIVSDVDGTLLNSQQQLTMRTEVAVARAAACGVPFILATGKSRGPWVSKVLPKLPIAMPGVFLQGLLTCDADGTVLESIELNADVATSIVRFAKQQNHTLVAFCGGAVQVECK